MSPGRPEAAADKRIPFEHDYDRLLFSTPVRRLADKTQVFPLERNDGVRTRLTHSHEVSNLARSICNRLLRTSPSCFGGVGDLSQVAPVIMATIGLAHDLGNPPFGHQGERAIGNWFDQNKVLFEFHERDRKEKLKQPVPSMLRNDFLKFEGNAQTLRLLARLQSTSGSNGLNLTAATLAALMKYTVPSHATNEDGAPSKKYGFFASENDVVDWIRRKTGLKEGQRHPLTWLMEACDDTAYSILDIEDAMKKELVSPEDLRVYIDNLFRKSEEGGGLVNQLKDDFEKADAIKADLSRVKEVKISYLRTRLIEKVITGAAEEFLKDQNSILSFQRKKPLLECGTFASDLIDALKRFARTHAYNSSGVLKVELLGAKVISKVMDILWDAISSRKEFMDRSSKRTSPQAAYAYSKISANYRWHFEHETKASKLPIRYHEMQLLTDMVSGMTDSFALELCDSLKVAVDD
ncbi:dGTP triphosphohydrolase [Dongia sp.]|uniref:dGTP triphosphohydrolase n=1 Tax=Dongia sp. TaxID=1977262 RepID=UPI0035B4BA25